MQRDLARPLVVFLATMVCVSGLVPVGLTLAGATGAPVPAETFTFPTLGALTQPSAAAVVPSAGPPNPFSSGMAASLVIGQPNFSSEYSGTGPANLSSPFAGAFDAQGDLWVVDANNNRIFEFRPPFHDGMNASLVIGQTSLHGFGSNTTQSGLSGPLAVAFDAAGDLWVSDSGDNRVLEFVPPFSTGMNAHLILGQSGFLASGAGTGATNLTSPIGLAFGAAGELFVSDSGNNRVLGYDPPFAIGMAATIVLGQKGFATTSASTTATGLYRPTDVAVGSNGSLWVADSNNNRTLGYAPPFSDGMAASEVLGPYNYTLTNQTTPYELTYPWGLSFDANGDLWVADSGSDRVLEYLAPVSTTTRPSVVIGEPSLTDTSPGNVSNTNLSNPVQTFFDPAGDLWVVDSETERVLEFAPAAYLVNVSELGLPNGTAWSATFDGQVGSAVAPGSISFSVWNGTHPFSVGAVAGYSSSPTSGSLTVTGAARAFTVAFAATASSSSGPSTGQLELAIYLLVAVVLVLVVALAFEIRRHRAGRAPPAASSWEPPAVQSPPPPKSP
ncbi:MAG: NHL repeat-containing protein [Thermoplasmata archaeon]